MFYLLFLLFSIVNSENCVCTTVACPVVGENYINMEMEMPMFTIIMKIMVHIMSFQKRMLLLLITH